MTEELAFDEIRCMQCVVEGEYLDETGNIPFNMIGVARKNHIKIKRQKVTYSVEILVLCNRKTISLTADKQVTLEDFYSLLMEIIRFENIFEGRFFPFVSFKLDGNEFLETINKFILGYIKSNRRYAWISLKFTDIEYKKMFLRFIKVVEKRNLSHQVYLYAEYSTGITADLRMAVLLQVFEPLANELAERGIIHFRVNPYKVFKNNCKNCGQKIIRRVPNKEIFFYDRLYAITVKYGKEIFVGDSKAKITRKAVNLRNRVDHVNKSSKNYMTGEQCGFYIIKYDLLYRRIIFEEIGVDYNLLKNDFVKNIEYYNNQFPQCRIYT